MVEANILEIIRHQAQHLGFDPDTLEVDIMLTLTLINTLDKPQYASLKRLSEKTYSHLADLLNDANIDVHPEAKEYSVSIYDKQRQTDLPHFFALTHSTVV